MSSKDAASQTTALASFDEVCATYEDRITAMKDLAEVERQCARDSKIRVGCVWLMIGLLAGRLLLL